MPYIENITPTELDFGVISRKLVGDIKTSRRLGDVRTFSPRPNGSKQVRWFSGLVCYYKWCCGYQCITLVVTTVPSVMVWRWMLTPGHGVDDATPRVL